MTKAQRAGPLKIYYGFRCTCPACGFKPHEQLLSDNRRRLLNILYCRRKGMKPQDVQNYGRIIELTPKQAEHPDLLRGVAYEKVEGALSHQEVIAYNIIYAGLMEAEGLYNSDAAAAYMVAATELARQISENPRVILVSSVMAVKTWFQRALDWSTRMYDKDSQEASGFKEPFRNVEMFLDTPKNMELDSEESKEYTEAFAICVSYVNVSGRQGRGAFPEAMTEKDFKDAVRAGRRIGRTDEEAQQLVLQKMKASGMI